MSGEGAATTPAPAPAAAAALGIARTFLPAVTAAAEVTGLVNDTNKDSKEEKEEVIEGFSDGSAVSIIQYTIGVVIFWAAIYMSFKCNKGFHLGDMLLACCCSTCYLVYRLAVPCRDKRFMNNFYNSYNNIRRRR